MRLSCNVGGQTSVKDKITETGPYFLTVLVYFACSSHCRRPCFAPIADKRISRAPAAPMLELKYEPEYRG